MARGPIPFLQAEEVGDAGWVATGVCSAEEGTVSLIITVCGLGTATVGAAEDFLLALRLLRLRRITVISTGIESAAVTNSK